MLRTRQITTLLPIALSAILLALAYPPVAMADLAFFATVPLLIILRQTTPKRGFLYGYAFGFLFRLINLSWLISLKDNGGPLSLVIVGLLALSLYCAIYTGLFGYAVSSLWTLAKKDLIPMPLAFRTLAWICEPLLWAGSEHLTGTILTGFPWNPLAATQYKNLALLSTVSLMGSGFLSAILIAINSSIASLLIRLWDDIQLRRTLRANTLLPPWTKVPRTLPLFCTLITLIAIWWHGIDRVRAIDRAKGKEIRASLIHPDAPSIFEKNASSLEDLCKLLFDYSSMAASSEPDLIVWPETILPGSLPYDPMAIDLITNTLASTSTPLITGGVEFYSPSSPLGESVLYNCAFFFNPGPTMAKPYKKRHLVPFGEYIPLESKIPLLKQFAPTGFSCEPGSEIVLHKVPVTTNGIISCYARIAPLICFEDAFSSLARESAQEGATILLSIANDAWFDGSYAAEQHLAQSVLRSVETGLPMLRATNKGVSAFILPNGRILRRCGNGQGSTAPGFITSELPFSLSPEETLYVKYGDNLFSSPTAGLLLGITTATFIIRRKMRKKTNVHSFH